MRLYYKLGSCLFDQIFDYFKKILSFFMPRNIGTNNVAKVVVLCTKQFALILKNWESNAMWSLVK